MSWRRSGVFIMNLNRSHKVIHAAGLFIYLQKTSENLWFSDILVVYGKIPVVSLDCRIPVYVAYT